MNTYMTHLLLLNHSVNPWIVPSEGFYTSAFWCRFYGVSCTSTNEAMRCRPITSMYLTGLLLHGTLVGYLIVGPFYVFHCIVEFL